jgi:hypothetical protein
VLHRIANRDDDVDACMNERCLALMLLFMIIAMIKWGCLVVEVPYGGEQILGQRNNDYIKSNNVNVKTI